MSFNLANWLINHFLIVGSSHDYHLMKSKRQKLLMQIAFSLNPVLKMMLRILITDVRKKSILLFFFKLRTEWNTDCSHFSCVCRHTIDTNDVLKMTNMQNCLTRNGNQRTSTIVWINAIKFSDLSQSSSRSTYFTKKNFAKKKGKKILI